jgi:hypothetical protein
VYRLFGPLNRDNFKFEFEQNDTRGLESIARKFESSKMSQKTRVPSTRYSMVESLVTWQFLLVILLVKVDKKCHMEGGWGLKSAEKVSHII